ncbi:MAG: sensor histidine kinase, partial [Candidatus Thermofonsia bacterium]
PARPTIYTYLTIQTGITIWLLILNPELNFYLIWLYVLAIEAIMLLSQREANIIIALYIVLTVGILLALLPLINAFISFPIYLGGFYFFISFAFATNRANQARAESQRLLAELQTTHQQLQTYAAQVETLAVSEERNRLAREMHDTVGHRLTVAAVQLEAAQKLVRKDADKAETMIATVREQVREALQELRQTVATLRHPLEVDLPLSQALRRLIRNFEEASGLVVNVLLPDDLPELPPAQRLAVYRTVQEGLTNVQKHAQATQVWLQLMQQNGALLLRMSDDGVGWPEKRPSTGFGLRGMAERAAQLGGELHLEPRPGGGAQLRLRLPMAAAVTSSAAVQENENE